MDKILILGGGISGLSAAWYLKKQNPHSKITLLEASSRLGGVIRTDCHQGSVFEKGPRTFAVSRSPHLLTLIEEAGLQEEILYSDPSSAHRYLWHQGALRSIKGFLPTLFLSLIKEAFVPKKTLEDETIYDYSLRRFNAKIAETLFDPMASGIYAGDIRKLSLRSCLPFLYEWEQAGDSVLKKMFFRKKTDSRLFTLQRGIQSLIDAMEKKLDIEIVLNCPVEKILKEGIEAGGKFWGGDRILSALPGPVLSSLTNLWPNFPSNSLWVVNVAFSEFILPKAGFGYLVPSRERESVLGMVWDSSIFLKRESSFPTIVTAMVRNLGDEAWAKDQALRALKTHLGCQQSPQFCEATLAENAIPQFEIGYRKSLERFQSDLQKEYPSLRLTGNYLSGVSVDACIQCSFDLSKKMF